MLDILEKVIWGVAILVVTSTGAWFALSGAPSTHPYIATISRTVNPVQLDRDLSKAGKATFAKIKTSIKQTRPAKNGRSTRPPTLVPRQINVDMLEKVANRTDALKEARKATGTLKENDDGTVSLVITEFSDENLFSKLGFEEMDEIQSVNGVPMDIGSLEALSLYDSLKEEFLAGKPIYVELKRNGKPTVIVFGPDESFGFKRRAAATKPPAKPRAKPTRKRGVE